jgi:hypothetical protein
MLHRRLRHRLRNALFIFSWFLVTLTIGFVSAKWTGAAEVVQLNPENWDEYAPAGKEADCIYGDYVMRSDRIIAVVGEAIPTRNANVITLDVGGSVIDLTRRDEQNDQLTCFYPVGGDVGEVGGHYTLTGPVTWPEACKKTPGAARLAFKATPNVPHAADIEGLDIWVAYELPDGADYLTLYTLLVNRTAEPLTVPIRDKTWAHGDTKGSEGFVFHHDEKFPILWCNDLYWRSAYAALPVNSKSRPHRREGDWKPGTLSGRNDYFMDKNQEGLTVPENGSFILERIIIPAADTFAVYAVERQRRGQTLATSLTTVTDPAGPVPGAYVEVTQGDQTLGKARADENGQLRIRLPAGQYTWTVSAQGRNDVVLPTELTANDNLIEVQMELPGYVEGKITNDAGEGIPCKIAFSGKGVEDPHFGPDTAVHGIRNLWYSHDGTFRVELLPGEYELLMSHGPEYDATLRTVQVKPGETTTVREQLRRSVNTSGWLSSDLHSHASESGDNITTQRGRVLNLLAEHLEFIPCTEHQRTSSYQPHLDYFGTAHRVLTCPGVELSGLPVALNHQNAFPLIHRPRTQDGGAPPVHVNPVAQIARLAMWDDQSDKVVQVNHPRTPQMLGDADRDGKPDEGFRKIFHYADIMEVHPLEEIFTGPETYREQGEGEVPRIQNWLQMLNLGYRLPGVVNTDAHRNYHGSGYLRNYIRSSTDDPSEADLMEICHALERGQVVMSNGPFMEVDAFSADDHVGPGEDLLSTTGAVELQIRVECPNWLDVNRVQVLVNGRPDERFNFTRRSHGKMFGNDTIKFNNRIRLSLPTDAHLIVVAAAEGRHLGKVFGPEHGELMPVAVSNPIFVDTDENGFQANGDLLGFPLPVESDHQPTHGHDHAKTSATFNE